ncbi:MAG: N-acetylmuramoyl-L-alanine amidase, partial [Sphingobacteriia bacterium]
MKGRNVACLLICFFWGAATAWGQGDAKSSPRKAIRRIVIDAGHGGTDVGARGKYSTESEVCLAIALRLEKMMKEALPDVEVFMTRTTDVYDDVRRKAEIANQAKGDLFLCIHANA